MDRYDIILNKRPPKKTPPKPKSSKKPKKKSSKDSFFGAAFPHLSESEKERVKNTLKDLGINDSMWESKLDLRRIRGAPANVTGIGF